MPTLVNNVESFAGIPVILSMGGKQFPGTCSENSGGTKLICLSGNVNNRGTYENPHARGYPADIIYNPELGGGIPGGKELKFYHLGGQSGPIGFTPSAGHRLLPRCPEKGGTFGEVPAQWWCWMNRSASSIT